MPNFILGKNYFLYLKIPILRRRKNGKYGLPGTIDGLNDQLYGPNGIIERANSRILNINETIENVNSDEEIRYLTDTIDRINGIRNQLTKNKAELDRRVAVAVARDNRQEEIELLAKMKDWLKTASNIDDLNTKMFLDTERVNNEPESLNGLFRLRGARGIELDLIKNAYREYTRENNINNIAAYLDESTEDLNEDLRKAVRYFNDGNYNGFAAFTMRKLRERIDWLQWRLDDEKEFVDMKVRDVLSDIENLEDKLR